MDWTLSQLRARFRELTGQLSTSQISNDDVDAKINDFYRNVFPDELALPELETFYSFNTVQSTAEYTLPWNYFRIEKPVTIDDGDGDVVGNMGFWQDKKAFFDVYPEDDGADEDAPLDLLLYGRLLYPRPIPDGVYTIKMAAIKRPDALSGDSSTLANRKWGPVIAYGTAIQALRDAKDVEGADALVSIYQTHKNSVNRVKLQQLTTLRSRPRF